ncbi:MAG: aldolase/citrate lyase family protein [Thermodesulfobacteriota bacterium]
MRTNRVKDKIRQGKIALGADVTTPDPWLVEAIGLAGFDAAFIDTEHTSMDFGVVENLVRACDSVGITANIRVPSSDPAMILRILDMGAQMITVPHIGGKDDALRAVRAVRYPPLGERGVGTQTRGYRVADVPLKEYIERSNAEILLAVMIEDKKAIDDVEEMASIEGLDLITVGAHDISMALGVPGVPSADTTRKTMEDIALRVKRVGKAKMSISLYHPASGWDVKDIGKLKSMGVACFKLCPDGPARLLAAYRQQVREVREELGKHEHGPGNSV